MKRVMTALLAAVTAVMMTVPTFAAEDPMAVYNRVQAKSNTMDSMDCNMEIHAIMMPLNTAAYGDFSINMDMDMKIQMSGYTTNNLRYRADVGMQMLGQTMFMQMFYQNGTFYMDMEGQKISYPMDMTEMVNTANVTAANTDFSASMIKNIGLYDLNGQRVLGYEMDTKKMNDYVQATLRDMQLTEGASVAVESLTGSYILTPDDYYTHLEMNMVMTVTIENETIAVLMKINGVVNDPGQPVEVTMPSTEGYVSMEQYLQNIFAALE